MNRVMHGAALFALVALLSATSALAAQDAKSKQKEFDGLLAKVKASDASVDFGYVRMLFTQLDGYSAANSGRELFEALNGGDFKKALELADKALEDNYLDVNAHLVAMVAADKLGKADLSAHHKYVVRGILDSIMKSGDGKSAATAFEVITVSEEYALLRAIGLQVKSQALQHADGHSYDVLTVADPESKAETSVYFNIDPVWAAETKMFGK